MNAANLHFNQDYAYHRDRGNAEFVDDAERVRFIKILRTEDRTTYVLVKPLNDDGTPRMGTSYNKFNQPIRVALPDKEVRARDILDRWDHYILERDDDNAVDWSEYANN